MSSDIILIGPSRAGKSRVGKLLAAQLERPFVDLTKVASQYYAEQGYDREAARQAWERGGMAGFLHYQAPFDARVVERALHDHQACVMDFGAGHSVQERDADFARIQALLAPYPNVILLLPSPDLDESVALLEERNTPKIGAVPLTHYLVTHPAFRSLATHVVYTQDCTPEETSAAILGLAHV